MKHKIRFVFDTKPGSANVPEMVEFTTFGWCPESTSIRDYCNKYGLESVAARCVAIFLDGKPVDYV